MKPIDAVLSIFTFVVLLQLASAQTPPTCKSNTTVEFLPHPTNCASYYVCSCGVPQIKTCGAGLQFDTVLKECQITANAKCFADVTVECPPTGISFHAHPNSCEFFFICIDGVVQRHQCAPNLVFNPTLSTCDDRNATSCP